MVDHLHIFVMAGGSGERFWPMSRTKTPKHLLRLLSEQTMLEMTVLRMEGVAPWERIFVLTNASQVDAIRRELPFLPPENIIAEPAKRDTAPACALATGLARARDPQAICALLPADSMIHNVPVLRQQVSDAARAAAANDALVTFSITPNHPATGFGYLHLGEEIEPGLHQVRRFVEKPDAETAQKYVASGDYGWNAGMFVWRSEVFLAECDLNAPALAGFIRQFPAADVDAYLAGCFAELPKISVDYAIMEKARQVLAVKAKFDWDDVGAWTSLPDHLGSDCDGNTARGEVHQVNSHNNVVLANTRVVALCGVNDLIVVETPDALLVCHRDAAQDIKKLQAFLPENVK